MANAIAIAVELAEGEGAITDPEAAAWVRRGLAAWLDADGGMALADAMGLPRSPRAARRTQRDAALREAAVELPAALGRWQRAYRLALVIAESAHHRSRARRTGLRQWSHGLVIGWLIEAERFGELPRTARQIANVLAAGSEVETKTVSEIAGHDQASDPTEECT